MLVPGLTGGGSGDFNNIVAGYILVRTETRPSLLKTGCLTEASLL